MNKIKLLHTATVPISLDYLLKGQLRFLSQHFEVVAVSVGDVPLRLVTENK